LSSSVLITGGTSSIGRALTEEFQDRGWTVYLHYNRSEETARSLSESAENVRTIQANLSDFKDCSELAETVAERSDLTVLINNAAVFSPTPENPHAEDWDLPMNVNARAPWYLSTTLADRLDENNGSIVNVTDAALDRPYSDYLPYFASKGALETLTRGLARKLSPGVRVNGVAPGPIDFPGSYSESDRQAVINRTLLERQGTHEEVARACTFLALEARYTTGTILEVDGGRHLN
jgi:pteridine reductase